MPAPTKIVELGSEPGESKQALEGASTSLGLALDASEIHFLVSAYAKERLLSRSHFAVELFMFAQVNSENCRHKQFNGSWIVDGTKKPHSLFNMIRNTHAKNPKYVVSAYSDNAAVLKGLTGSYFAPRCEWIQTKEIIHHLAKVEINNHPRWRDPG